MANSDFLYSDIQPPIGWLIFNRPQKRNVLNIAMWQLLPKLLVELDRNPQIRVIILTGAGEQAFIAGADISEFADIRKDKQSSEHYNHITQLAFQAIRNTSKPVISMIQGFCIGGGCAIALNTDIRIASEDSVFSLPPAKLGLGYGYENIEQVVKTIGPSYAKELLFTADKIEAQRAHHIGIIHHCLTRQQLKPFTEQMALRIAQNAPLSIRAIKIAIEEFGHNNRDAEKISQAMNDCYNSNDYREGYTAFLEKRKPIFRGD